MRELERRIRCLVGHKYAIAFIVFLLIAGVADDLSLWQKYLRHREISHLRDGIAEYNNQFKRDSLRLRQLQRDPHEIVNIAREKYFMRADNEDVYVIVE